MFNTKIEVENRVDFIQKLLKETNANGIVFGNSGGKDSALVGILCKMATKNVLGVIMPCCSKRNYEEDALDGANLSNAFNIDCITLDLSEIKLLMLKILDEKEKISNTASSNISPRLRMTALYAIAQSKNYLVAGTGNKDEIYMGYFTKWGDGGSDFNPISDLTVSEVYKMLEYLQAPDNIIKKAPSAGLYEGQTDEKDMGVTYKEIDEYLTTGKTSERAIKIIDSYHKKSEHKRKMPITYKS